MMQNDSRNSDVNCWVSFFISCLLDISDLDLQDTGLLNAIDFTIFAVIK